MGDKNKLFVYGTLAPGNPNAYVLSALEGNWEPATIRGKLYPEGWGAALGFPAIVLDNEGDEIEGFVFSSPGLEAFWPELDAFEGEAYERIGAEVRLADGTVISAYVYALRT